MDKRFKGKNYSISITDGTEVVNGSECSNGWFLLTKPDGEIEVFELFEELIYSHPICEESRSTFCDNIATAEMFCEYLPLDYACSLAKDLVTDEIEDESAIVTKLIMQVQKAGLFIERSIAADVLRSVCEPNVEA